MPRTITKIGGGAFCNCTSLEHIIIPKEVTNIGNTPFYNWPSTSIIYIEEKTSAPSGWAEDWSSGCNADIEWNATIPEDILYVQTATSNRTVDVQFPVATLSGYGFLGWSTNANATKPTYTKDGLKTFNMGETDEVLYAIWGKQYFIALNPNGGTYQGSTNVKTGFAVAGKDINFGVPEREGYTFVQWITTDGSIYDRNLLKGAEEPEFKTPSTNENAGWRSAGSGTGTRNIVDITNPPIEGVKKGFEIESKNAADTVVSQDTIKVQLGKKYTISAWAKGTGKLVLEAGKSDGSGNGGYVYKHFDLTNETQWKKYTYTFEATTSCTVSSITNIYFGNRGTSGTLQICGMKLEEGEGFSSLFLEKANTPTIIFIAEWKSNQSNMEDPGLYLPNGTFKSWDQLVSEEFLTVTDGRLVINTDKKEQFQGRLVISSTVTTIGNLSQTNLNAIEFPETLTGIDACSMLNCSSVSDIIIPSSCSTISTMAFYNWTSSQTIHVQGKSSKPANWASDWSGNATVEWNCTHSNSSSGLYNYSTGVKTKTWAELINEGIITVTDGAVKVVEGKKDQLQGKLIINSSVTALAINAFANCTNLKQIVIPETVTQIGGSAFSGCTNLIKVNIPTGVTAIGGSVFSGCSSISDLYLHEGIETIDMCNWVGWTSSQTVHVKGKSSRPTKWYSDFAGAATIEWNCHHTIE